MIILHVLQWNVPLLAELVVPSQVPLQLISLKGALECLQGSLGASGYLLVSILLALSFLMYESTFRRDPTIP